MLEMLANPKRAEREPWEMFFIGLVYASVALLLSDWIFLKDSVLSQYMSMLIVTFTVLFTIPFMFFIISLEEKKDKNIKNETILIREHGKALAALIYLFLGFVVAFSFWYIVMSPEVTAQNFKAQIEQYCAINMPFQFDACVSKHGVINTVTGQASAAVSGGASQHIRQYMSILVNNIYVLIFVLIFSLAFGAGAIFILAWNASVIAAAVGIFTEASLKNLHVGLLRYMIHGIPEIAAYFVGALAGGILSIAVIRHEFRSDKFWRILQDSVDLIVVAIVILVLAALVEVFITPRLFY